MHAISPICGFAPVARPDARILILGSMPGIRSLTEQQYYAHPQNLFWKILGEITGTDPALPYSTRLEQLIAHRIALWDVMQQCERRGSLDSDIIEHSIIPNDFQAFFRAHPGIDRVLFNGTKAESAFMRHVKPTLQDIPNMDFFRLPSTSPANASIPFEIKRAAWQTKIAASQV